MINSTPTMRNPTTAWLEDARRLLRQIEENVANLVTCLDPTGSLGLRVLLVGAGIIRVAADCVRRELTIQVP
jgi:hypothetical protein